jgi:23S rRNA-/tRNA-specific pseudouridylate synthase
LLAAQAAFASGQARKTYWAVVRGHPGKDHGTIDAPLIRRNTRDGWHIAVDPAGQQAATDWRVLGCGIDTTWLELRPRTGRTHQIRVHCAATGCPIVGDHRYGGGAGALHLLARAIHLPLAPPLRAQAEPPPHMHRALLAAGWAHGSIGAATENDRKIS